MRPLAAVVLAAALLVAGVLVRGWFWPSEETRVRRTLDALLSAVSVPEGETDVARLARVRDVAAYLALDVAVDPGRGLPPLTGRDAVLGVLAQARVAGPLSVRAEDTTVALDQGAEAATVTASILVEGRDRRGEPTLDAREVTSRWTRQGSAWILSRVAVQRPLE